MAVQQVVYVAKASAATLGHAVDLAREQLARYGYRDVDFRGEMAGEEAPEHVEWVGAPPRDYASSWVLRFQVADPPPDANEIRRNLAHKNP